MFKIGDRMRIRSVNNDRYNQLGIISDIFPAMVGSEDGEFASLLMDDMSPYYAYLTELAIEKYDNGPLPLPG